MTTIWKYPLEILDQIVLQMPGGGEILSVAMQGSTLCLWAIVAPGSPLEERIIHVRGTGHPMGMEGAWKHIGTVIDGSLVWHVFEEPGA